jgi:hypothetical protein
MMVKQVSLIAGKIIQGSTYRSSDAVFCDPGQGRPAPIAPGLDLQPAGSTPAPLLAGGLLIESADGWQPGGEWEPELAGDIVLLHRGGHFLDSPIIPIYARCGPCAHSSRLESGCLESG